MSHLAPRCALICALLSSTLLGCPGNLDDPERFQKGDSGTGTATAFVCPASGKKVKEELIVARCGTAGCHDDSQFASGGLDMLSPDLPHRLIDIPATGCAGKVLITADGGGYVFDKLQQTPSCGSRMPVTGPPLTATEQQCLAQWAIHVLDGGAE